MLLWILVLSYFRLLLSDHPPLLLSQYYPALVSDASPLLPSHFTFARSMWWVQFRVSQATAFSFPFFRSGGFPQTALEASCHEQSFVLYAVQVYSSEQHDSLRNSSSISRLSKVIWLLRIAIHPSAVVIQIISVKLRGTKNSHLIPATTVSPMSPLQGAGISLRGTVLGERLFSWVPLTQGLSFR